MPVTIPAQQGQQPGVTSPYPSPQPPSVNNMTSSATLMPPQHLNPGQLSPANPGRPSSTGMCLTMPPHDNLSPRPNSTGRATVYMVPGKVWTMEKWNIHLIIFILDIVLPIYKSHGLRQPF